MINFLKKLLPKSSTKTDLVNNSNASAIAKEQQPKAGFLKSFDEARDKFKAKTNLKSLAQNKRAFQQQIGSKNNNKRSRYIVLSISTIISLLLATPLVIDNSGLKSQLELKIGDKIKANITIQNVEIALFPSPKIVMNNVAIQNFVKDGNIYDLMAGAIEIKTGFFAILLRKFNLKELNFYNAALSGYDQLSQSGDRKNFAIDALNKTGSNNFTTSSDSLSIFSLNGIANQNLGFSHIPRINIYNLNFITHDQFSKEKRFDQINLEISNSGQKITAKGYFLTGGTVNNIELISSLKKNAASDSSKLIISSINLEFRAIGAFNLDQDSDLNSSDTTYNQLLGLKFNGKISGEIKNLKRFYRDYLSNSDLIYTKLNPAAESINFTAAITNQSNDIVISDLTVNSALITGAGNIEIDTKTPQTKIVINFNLDNLDFDSLWLNDAFYASKDPNSNDLPSNDQLQTINLATNSLPNNQNSDLDIKARITIKNAKYLGAKINDFDLSASSFDQYSVLINPITFNIMDSTAKITGVLKNESDLKFIGHIEVKGNKLQDLFTNVKIDSENLRYDNLKNYNLQSGLVILPNLTILNNLSFKLDDKNEFLGNIKIDSSKKINNIISDFKVNEFNVDDYFLISGQNSYLSSGLLIKKIFWLNNITSTHKVNLSFDKLIYKNELFENQSVNMEFGQGYLSINNLLLKSNDTDLTANLDLDIRGSTPLITINLAADKFHYQTTQLNQQPPNVAAGAPVSAPNNQNNFTDQFFALPSLTGVDGKINLKIANLTLDQLTAKNLKIIGEIKDGNIDFSDFNAEMLGGKIEFKGSAIIRSEKLINGNIILSNISLKPLLNGLFGLNNIDGVSNIAASFRSSADNKKDFIRNIDSNLKFSIRSLEVEGYGLNDLVIKLFDPNNNLTELTNPQQILFNQNAKTVFEKATGELNISKTDENKLHVDLSSLAINGLVSGNINLVQKDINLTANIIFLTGTRKKQLPLNIISNLKGEIDNFSQNTNLSQVNQYLQMIYGNQTINNNPGQNVNNVNNPILDKMPATQPSPSNITP